MLSRYVIPCLALLASGPLAAVTISSDVPSIIVDYSDLNLNSDVGISRLYSRIKYAAKEVCEPSEVRSGRAYVEHGCLDRAIARAVADVQSSRLATLHGSLTSQR